MNKPLYLVLVVGFLTSCGIKKIITTDFSAPPKNAAELMTRVNSKNNHPEWLSLKGRANIVQKDQEIMVRINIKTRKDSIVWISASGLFGIEIIRAQLTLDSIYFLNRINKTYLIKPASQVRNFLKSDFSFYDIQDIITANPKILKKNYKLEVNKIGFSLVSDNLSYYITNNYRIQNVKGSENTNSVEFTLEDYQEIDNFPRKVTLKVEAEGVFETSINYSKVEFNKSQKILFEIPDYYDEIK